MMADRKHGNDVKQNSNGVPNGDNSRRKSLDQSPPTPEIQIAPDGGWGWVIVLASFICNLIVDGICYTFGIINSELVVHFNTTSSTTAWAGSLCAGFYLITGPVASALSNRFGCRVVGIAGSVIAGVSFFISGFSNSIEMLLITYGVMGGIGLGLMYLPAIVMVGHYFDKRRALATGISVCGSSVGIFVMAPLASHLVDEYNWKGTNIVLAGIIFNGIVFGALYRPLTHKKHVDLKSSSYIIEVTKKEKRSRTYSVDEDDEFVETKEVAVTIQTKTSTANHNGESVPLNYSENTETAHHGENMITVKEDQNPFDRKDVLYPGNLSGTREFKEAGNDLQTYVNSMSSIGTTDKVDEDTSILASCGRVMGEMFDISLLKSPTFIIICVSGFIVYLGLYTPFVYSVAKAESLGSTVDEASFILVVIGVTNTISRLATGFIADLPCVDSVLVYNVAAILAGLATCLVSVFNTFTLLLVYGALFGVFIAAFIALRSIIIADLLGITKLNNGFGLMCLVQGIAAIVGSPFSGFLFDSTQSYSLPFIVSGLMLALGGLLCLPIRRIARWEQSRLQNLPIVNNSQTSTSATTPS